ncbi:MAG: ABC transporter ATP-binding protein [Alphaproteobacteria bacterium]|nr:ABC transporter ATP-binding protein [Alphaproteobacteria bacterium]
MTPDHHTPPDSVAPPLLELRNISKRFAGAVANDNISLSLAAGEIHALLGENGAGKSTLVQILYGRLAPDSGAILWNGNPARFHSPQQARAAGIAMVFQHFVLFEAMNGLENLRLGLPPRQKNLAADARKLAKQYGLDVPLARPVRALSVGERQRLEILRCLMQRPRLLVMDEPTSVLAPSEVESLFTTLRRLAADGAAILYISHKLHEARALCGGATILRNGRVTARLDPRETSAETILARMLGDGDGDGDDTPAPQTSPKDTALARPSAKNGDGDGDDNDGDDADTPAPQTSSEDTALARPSAKIGDGDGNGDSDDDGDGDTPAPQTSPKDTALARPSARDGDGGDGDDGGAPATRTSSADVALARPFVKNGDTAALAELARIPQLEVKNLSTPGNPGMALKDISFSLAAGEILGIAGIAGNGQSELMETLTGETPLRRLKRGGRDSGQILFAGAAIETMGAKARRRLGVAAVPEDRYGHGAVGEMTLAENVLLTGFHRRDLNRLGWLRARASAGAARGILRRFHIRARPATRAAALSGGNLQRFIMGRALTRRPALLLVCQPTWGVDARAARALHLELASAAKAGTAVLLVSQDLDELLALADRVAVLNRGRLSPALDRASASRARLGQWMVSGFAPDDDRKNDDRTHADDTPSR